MPANLASFDAILKNDYLGPVREQLNNATELLRRIGTDYESVVGKNFTIPMHYGRNEGVGARSDGALLMAAGQQSYKESIVPMRYLYGRIQITGPTMKAARNDSGAFLRAVDSEIKGVTRDLKQGINRMLSNDGTGRITTCGTTTASTTVTVASSKLLRPGMVVDIIVATTGAAGTGGTQRTITAVPSATTITISGAAITTDSTYALYVYGSRNLEVMGLQGMVSDSDIGGGYGSFQNLGVASYPWHSSYINALGGAISDIAIQTMIDEVEQKGDGEVSGLYTTYGVRRAYQALLDAQKRLVNKYELRGGYNTIAYNDMPVIVDKNMPAGVMFGLDESTIKMFKMADYDWMDMDGAVLSRVSGYDAYEAIMYCYMELGTGARNSHGKITGITEA
jgi:hypothetical protein